MSRKSSRGVIEGRPAFEPTPDQRLFVQVMAGFKIPHAEIARAIINPTTNKGVTEVTLRLHFREELDNGVARVKGQLAITMLKRAKEDASGAVAIFLAKQLFGWADEFNFMHKGLGAFERIEELPDEALDRLVARIEERLRGPSRAAEGRAAAPTRH